MYMYIIVFDHSVHSVYVYIIVFYHSVRSVYVYVCVQDILEFVDVGCNKFLSNLCLVIASYTDMFLNRGSGSGYV